VDSGRPKESCIWWAHYPDPKEAAVLWVILGHAQICKQFIFSTLFARGQEQYHLGLPVYSSSLLISVRFIPVHFLPVQLLPLPLTHAHPFNGSFSGTTLVSRTRKIKPIWILVKQDSEWQWHQLGHMQVCTLLQTDNHISTPPLCFLQAGCPSCHLTNSIKTLKATS